MKKIQSLITMLTILFTFPAPATKLVSLNIWGGHVKEPLVKFIENNQDVDIFCLQEVYDNAPHRISTDDNVVALNIFSELAETLPEHEKYFLPVVEGIYGIGMFVRKGIHILDQGEVNIHDNPHYVGRGPTHGRSLQWIECESAGNRFYVVNVHGLWNGKGKSDSPERIKQSQKIREFVDSLDAPIVLCGDFNLTPDTQSMAILEAGMDNLIEKYNVTSTRTSYYPKEIRFADYVLTSPDISVDEFKVLPDEVSDHNPLYLEFTVPIVKSSPDMS